MRRTCLTVGIALALGTLAAATSPSFALDDTHLDEIAFPFETYADARIAAIDALPAPGPTKAEKSERKKLDTLRKKLRKSVLHLANDFNELVAVAQYVHSRKLDLTSDPATLALDACSARASIALSERSEFGYETIIPLAEGVKKDRLRVQFIAAADTRDEAAAEARADKRAKLLQKAERTLTGTIKKAEGMLAKAHLPFAPTRYRSGDYMGVGGGRLAIARDSGTPLAGASILFPPGAMPLGLYKITLSEGPDIVSDPSVPTGAALHVSVDKELTLNGPVTVYVPCTLPDGASADDLEIRRDDGVTTNDSFSVTQEADGTLSGKTTAIGSFQSAVAPAATDSPNRTYVLQSLVVTAAPGVVPASAAASVMTQSITFRRNGTGTATAGITSAISRSWTANAPHHADFASTGSSAEFTFTWTLDATGRFSFDLPFGLVTVHAQGVASHDTNVISISGHGNDTDLMATGLRTSGAKVFTSDLSGRWAAAELSVQAADSGSEPFRTIVAARQRNFTADTTGIITYGTGSIDTTTTDYQSQSANPTHNRSSASSSENGSEQWVIADDGTLTDGAGQRTGVFDPVSNAIFSTVYSAGTGTVRLAVAVRQPASSSPPLPDGSAWEFVRFGIGQTQGTPDAQTSTLEPLATTASVFLQSGNATDTVRAGTRTVYSLNGVTSSQLVMTWALTGTTSSAGQTSAGYTPSFSASGNFDSADGYSHYMVSGDGNVVIGTYTDDGTRLVRGMLVGVR